MTTLRIGQRKRKQSRGKVAAASSDQQSKSQDGSWETEHVDAEEGPSTPDASHDHGDPTWPDVATPSEPYPNYHPAREAAFVGSGWEGTIDPQLLTRMPAPPYAIPPLAPTVAPAAEVPSDAPDLEDGRHSPRGLAQIEDAYVAIPPKETFEFRETDNAGPATPLSEGSPTASTFQATPSSTRISRTSTSEPPFSYEELPDGWYRCLHPETSERCSQKRFDSMGKLNKHQRNHKRGSQLPHKCKLCSERFLYPKGLEAHELNEHLNARLYCPVCGPGGKLYTRNDNRVRHMKDLMLPQHIKDAHAAVLLPKRTDYIKFLGAAPTAVAVERLGLSRVGWVHT